MSAEKLSIRLFGELAVFKGGEAVPLPQSKKTRALLAYLALAAGPQRRQRLCEIFWELPDDPRASLRWALTKIRAIVNDEARERIKADRDRVEFDVSDVAVDFLELERLLSSDRLQSLDADALQTWADRFSGEALDGLELSNQPSFETFRLTHQEKARTMRARLLRVLIARLDADPASRADRLYQLVEVDPYDIYAHRDLITALAQAGRRKEAERQQKVSTEALEGVEGVDFDALRKATLRPPHVQKKPRPAAKTVKSAASRRQDIRYCKSADGVQIAYAKVGEGRPLVKTANWLNHLEFDWESPVWSHVFDALTQNYEVVRYDARGNGLSDWCVKDFSLDRQVEDLEAVVDAAGLDRFPLLGLSQGCAFSVKYAARHPEKVSKLILYGGYARGWKRLRSQELYKSTEAMITLVRTVWGKNNPVFRQMFASLFMPDAPKENHQWFNELQRMTTSPENAADLLDALGDVDVSDCLADVKAPTLVIHARGDMRMPLGAGRELATGIPGARFVTLETQNHLIPENDPAWRRVVDVVNDFLSE